jgi:hypothetical protein
LPRKANAKPAAAASINCVDAMATGVGGSAAGTICWAKMRGHRSWPAQLLDDNTSASSSVRLVKFFGTHDTASVAKVDLEPWQGTRFKQLCGKSKDKKFTLAIKEAAYNHVQRRVAHDNG